MGLRIAAIMAVLLLSAPAGAETAGGGTPGEPDPRAILDRIDDLFRGDSSYARMTMKVTTAHWARELKLEAWSEGRDRTLVRILSPKKERGMATLKVGNDIWNYLPRIRRVIKLPSSMMGDSWMGSHFTNDDLVKDSRMADDYSFELAFRGERGGVEVAEVSCVPRPDASVVWGRILVRVRAADTMPLRITYYDEDLKPAREMTFSGFRVMGGRLLPARSEIVPADKPKESTVIVYEEMDFGVPLKGDMFSLGNLQR